MAQPPPYTPDYNFSDWQAAHSTSPLPASPLDNELANVAITLAETLANLRKIQRDDTELGNQTVGIDQLKPELRSSLAVGALPIGVYSVKTFGVKGDGSSDDTIAIQAAIDSGTAVLYFPTGTYIFTQITLRSNQIWVGDGMGNSIMSLAQVDRPANINGFISSGDLSNVIFQDMGFRGNVNAQVTNNGNFMFGFYIRGGACKRITWERCKIWDWGSKTGAFGERSGGCLVLGGSTGTVEDITIRGCSIGDGGNVPGVYISGLGIPVNTQAKNILITQNTFFMTNAYAYQNMIYIVGYNNQMFENITVSDNVFDLQQSLDATLEINYARNIVISGNIWALKNTAECEAVLLRSGIENCTISGNIFNNSGTGCVNRTAVAITAFTGELQKNISITGNTFKDWGASLLSLATTCENVEVVGNNFVGELRTPSVGVDLGNVQRVLVANNYFRNVGIPFLTGGAPIGAQNLTLTGNLMIDCGVDGNTLISTPVGDVNVTNAYVAGNTVSAPKTGTVALWGVAAVTFTGNRIENNILPQGFPIFNASYPQYIERVVAPADVDGILVARKTYEFEQGQINMSTGFETFTIGGNLDQFEPICEPGDQVLVGCTSDLTGAVISGFVKAYKQVRVQILKAQTADLSILAGTWFVTIIRRTPDSTLGSKLRIARNTFTINTINDVTIGGSNSISLV